MDREGINDLCGGLSHEKCAYFPKGVTLRRRVIGWQ